MEAHLERAGEIADYKDILCRGKKSADSPYICVHLRSKWQWQSLKNISGTTFIKIRTSLSKNMHNSLQDRISDPSGVNLVISRDSTNSSEVINGTWKYDSVATASASQQCVSGNNTGGILEGEELNIYKKTSDDDDDNKYLFCVKTALVGAQPEKYVWWIGTEGNMKIRKGWGWFRQKTPTNHCVVPWQINSWYSWQKPSTTSVTNGEWKTSQTIVEIMDKNYLVKEGISKTVEKLRKETEETINVCNAAVNCAKNEVAKHKDVSRELFNKLTIAERIALTDTSKFRAIFKKADLCSCCFSDDKTTKCIHTSCTGACEKCRGETEDDDCCACGKKQELECPICMSDFKQSFMKIFKCKHAVCYKCNSRAYEVGRPLKKCPKCRADI